MSMLAERRRKMKWIINPTKKPLWTSDSSGIKFGKELMEKMGWSSGKGLGVNEQGIQEPLKVSYKNDTKGMGYKGNDDNWIEQQDEFNELLNKLRNDNTSSVVKISREERVAKSLEEKSKQSRVRVHYQKFTRGKDLSRYSDNDLACILGTNKMQKEKSKTGKVVQTEPKVVGNCETSFGVTTINSGSIQDYFKKKWIIDKKLNHSSNKFGDVIDISSANYQKIDSCFIKNEHDLMSESEEEKYKKTKHKSDSEEYSNINGNKTFNVLTSKNLKKSENHLTEVLNYEESKSLVNEVHNYDLVKKNRKEKNQLKLDVVESEKNYSCVAKKKRKVYHESDLITEVSFVETVGRTNVEFTLEEEKTHIRKKKKFKKEKLKKIDELKEKDYFSEAPLSTPNGSEVIEFNLKKNSDKKNKKENKEKYLLNKDIKSTYYNNNNNNNNNENEPSYEQEKINRIIGRDDALDINAVNKRKKKKCKKEKLEKEESINCHTGSFEKFNLREELREKNINTNEEENALEVQSFRKKKKKSKVKKLDEKEKADKELSCGHIEKSVLEETSKETNINKVIFNTFEQKNMMEDDLYQKSKKKKDKKERNKKEEIETENINCYTNHGVKMQVQGNNLELELEKKRKRKKEKKEKLDEKEKADMEFGCHYMKKSILEEIPKETNINNINIDSTKTKLVNEKMDEKEKYIENKEESCKYLSIEKKVKVQKYEKIENPICEMTDKKIDLSNNKKNSPFHSMISDKVEDGTGVHKHKIELLNEKRADKFYPGWHTNDRVLRLICWSNIAGFKGSNLDSVTGYGFLTKYETNKSK